MWRSNGWSDRIHWYLGSCCSGCGDSAGTNASQFAEGSFGNMAGEYAGYADDHMSNYFEQNSNREERNLIRNSHGRVEHSRRFKNLAAKIAMKSAAKGGAAGCLVAGGFAMFNALMK